MQSSIKTEVKQKTRAAVGKVAATRPQTTIPVETDTVLFTGDIEMGAKPDLWALLRSPSPISELRNRIPQTLYAEGQTPDRRAYSTVLREIYPQYFEGIEGTIQGVKHAVANGSMLMAVFFLNAAKGNEDTVLDELSLKECDRAYWLLQVATHDPELKGCF